MVVDALHHACGSRSLNTIHLDGRIQRLDGEGNAREKSATTYGHHNSLDVGQLITFSSSKGWMNV